MTHLKCHFDFPTTSFLSFDVPDDVLHVVLDASDIRIRADRLEPDFKRKLLNPIRFEFHKISTECVADFDKLNLVKLG